MSSATPEPTEQNKAAAVRRVTSILKLSLNGASRQNDGRGGAIAENDLLKVFASTYPAAQPEEYLSGLDALLALKTIERIQGQVIFDVAQLG